MTVCIGAVCVDRNRYFAILCSDGRIEIEGIASGEIGHKAIGIAPGINAMFADSKRFKRKVMNGKRADLSLASRPKGRMISDEREGNKDVEEQAEHRADYCGQRLEAGREPRVRDEVRRRHE